MDIALAFAADASSSLREMVKTPMVGRRRDVIGRGPRLEFSPLHRCQARQKIGR